MSFARSPAQSAVHATSEIPAATGIPDAAYIHIPFCRRRCFYCDFPISVVGDRRNGSNSGTIHHYLEALTEEIEQTPDLGNPLATVFFGGGTPSLLTAAQLAGILEQLQRKFGLLPDAEISMEIDPGTFDLAQIQGYRAAGVNRVSLGVQAFQPELLQLCGRTHTDRDIPVAVDLLHQADIPVWSLDLISGLPHQTLEHWQESLERAIALQPQHLSCYDLAVEPGTPFSRQYHPGDRPLPGEETTATMYRLGQQLLTAAGYDHYEISNYAKPGYPCRHNRVYWENRPYYGFGMGATSYIRGNRLARPRTIREYQAWVENGGSQLAVTHQQPDDRVEILLDTLMLGLRLAEGVDRNQIGEGYGLEVLQRIDRCLQPYQQQGWVEQRSERLCLSDPEGFLFSNVVLIALFDEFSQPP